MSSPSRAALPAVESAAAGARRPALIHSPRPARRAWRRFKRNKVSLVALAVACAILLFVMSAGLISEFVTGMSYDDNRLGTALAAPGEHGYLLGSDGNGRDILTRLAYGGRVSLLVATLTALATLIIGGAIGTLAGYYGHLADAVLMRLVDVLLSIPSLALLILIASLYRPGYIALAFVIATVSWPAVARLIRGEVLALRRREFVDAARLLGASNSHILLRHILPNVVPTIVVWTSLVIPGFILTEAVLSFVGLGVRIPTPSWGNMLQEAQQFYRQNWTNVFFPGCMIYIMVLSINLIGNGLRDALDPRLGG